MGTCKVKGCRQPIFSNEFCKYHQHLNPKRKRYVYRRKPTGELKIFEEIWKERSHVSFLSGKPLGYFSVSFFAHVLAKGRYPRLRLEKSNIILLTPFEHHLFDMGTRDLREKYGEEEGCNWEKVYSLVEKSKYENR